MGPTGLSTAFKVSALVCSLEMYISYFCDTSNPQVFAMVAVFLARWGRPLASSLGPTGNPLKGLWAGTNVPGSKVGKVPLLQVTCTVKVKRIIATYYGQV